MRILVYGAGVQGCELAHRLLQNKKNVVTMLARGEWKERLNQRGLVIRHWAQCRTTVDRVATIDTLAPDDCYDLVFVTMQAGRMRARWHLSHPSMSLTKVSLYFAPSKAVLTR